MSRQECHVASKTYASYAKRDFAVYWMRKICACSFFAYRNTLSKTLNLLQNQDLAQNKTFLIITMFQRCTHKNITIETLNSSLGHPFFKPILTKKKK